MTLQKPWFLGLMSGTSLDGVDAVLTRWGSPDASDQDALWLTDVHHHWQAWPDGLRRELAALNRSSDDELHRMAVCAQGVAQTYARVTADLLELSGIPASEVCAIGAHGQTVRHHPKPVQGPGISAPFCGYSTQLLDGALLAERTGIDVICDFRSRDLAAEGQGAPLVPAFHQAWLEQLDGPATQHHAVLNLGGIANWSILPASGSAVFGFDCGPANTLLDAWCLQHTGQAYDNNGHWAASGQVVPALLASMLTDPFFALPAPKSTGLDYFHLGWLLQHIQAVGLAPVIPADVQATLVRLSSRSAAQALAQYAPQTSRIYVCGGGAANAVYMQALQEDIQLALDSTAVKITNTQALGVHPQHVEALAFAWLARRFTLRQPGNLPTATGASGPRILGCLYPA